MHKDHHGDENTGRFTIRADSDDNDGGDMPELPPAVAADEPHSLPMDRLNARITRVLLAMLVLMGVVLAVMYLDLRKRMNSTQTTGSAGIERLTETLGALADKQIALETGMAAQTQSLETATAGMQVKLKTTVDEVQRAMVRKPDQAALEKLDKAVRQMESQLAGLRKEVSALNTDLSDLSTAVTKFDEEMSDQIRQIVGGIKKNQEAFSKNQETFAALEKKTQSISVGQVDKAALDLAIRLERMSVQEMMKTQAQTLTKKLSALESAQAVLKKQVESMERAAVSAPPAAYSPPKPVTVPSSGMTGGVTEQSLN